MLRPCAWILTTLALTARLAHGDCLYTASYPTSTIGGPCVATPAVPLGCPISYAEFHQAGPGRTTTTVQRGAATVELASETRLVASVPQAVSRTDFYSCDCAKVTSTVDVDHLELRLVGAQVGDVVMFPGGADSAPAAGITAAGPCPAVVWPTQFTEQAACDLCPSDPTMGGARPPDGGGCAASTSTSTPGGLGGVALLLAALVGRRRRAA
jgi:uncharacterized protein (TIGR03382 family)